MSQQDQPGIRVGWIVAGVIAAVAVVAYAAVRMTGHSKPKIGSIMAIGDSLTYGFSYDPQVPHGGWTVMIPRVRVIDEGKCGATPASILPVAVMDVKLGTPAIITVGIGTNCFFYKQPESEAERDYDTLVRAIHAADPAAKIILATIPPPCPSAWASIPRERNVTIAKTRAFNVFVRAYAQRNGYPLADVERDAHFVPSDYSDQLHFKRQGYVKIAAVMAGALEIVAHRMYRR